MKRRTVPKRKKALRDPFFESMRQRSGGGVHKRINRNERKYINYLLDYEGEINEEYFDLLDEMF